MRFLFIVYCLLALAGCVNYMGVKPPTAKAYNAETLAIHHDYAPPHVAVAANQNDWWTRFHDQQLNQFIATALIDSPNLHAAESRVKRAQAIAEGASASLWPTVNLDGSLRRERFSADGLIPPPFNGITTNIADLALNFQYEFDFWGKNRQTIAARVSEAHAVNADFAEARLVIASAVASSYFQLRSNIALLNVAEKILQERNAILHIVKLRAMRGVESDIPLTTVEANAQTAAIAVARVQQAVMINRHQLAILMGKNPFTTKIAVKQFVYNQQVLSLPAILPANLLGQRPDIIAARWRVEAACHEVNVAKSRFFPNINLTGLLSYQSLIVRNLFNPNNRDDAIQGAFDLPIFDAGLRRANLSKNYAEYAVAVEQYNQTILAALRDVADQLAGLDAVKTQYAAQRMVLSAAKNKYGLTHTLYQHGIAEYMQVLEVQDAFLNQQQVKLKIEAEHIQSVLGMIKALGGNLSVA